MRQPHRGCSQGRRHWLRVWPLAPLWTGWTPPLQAQPAGRTWVVGPGERLTTLAAAVRAADSGDVIELQPGTYPGDVAVIAQPRLTLRGLGDGAVLHADGRHAEGKATLVVRGGEVTIENLEFRGARVPSGNGAGIRFEAGQLRLQRCRFFDNEMGLLSAGRPDMALQVLDCAFGDAPRHDGLLHHLLYVGTIGRLDLRGSRFAGGWRGHLVKSRAAVNRILYNRLDDGPGGEASYELEFPNGGDNLVVGNVIGQGAATQNPALLSMAAEAPAGARGRLVLAHNTFVDRAGQGRFVHLWAQRLQAPLALLSLNNLFCTDAAPAALAATAAASGVVLPAPGDLTDGNHRLSLRALRDPDTGDYRLRRGVLPAAALAPLPAQARPQARFAAPAGTRPLAAGDPAAPGAPGPAD